MKKIQSELTVYSGIAILFVAWIHANAQYLISILGLTSYNDADILLLVIDKIIHPAVPMFIFISGFKYKFSEGKTYKEYSKSRLFKILVPFLIISIFFILGTNLYLLLNGNINIIMTLFNIFLDFAKALLGYNFVYPLWYVPMYLFVVLVYPIIKKFVPNQKIRFIIFISLATSYTLLSSVLGVFGSYIYPFNFIYYFVFFELGYYISQRKVSKTDYSVSFIVYLIALLVSVFTSGSTFGTMWYSLVFNMVAVCAFYYLSLNLKENKWLNQLGKYSFFIFLFHEPLFVTLPTMVLDKLNLYNNYLVTLLIVIGSIIFSILTYKTIEQIKLIVILFYKRSNSEI